MIYWENKWMLIFKFYSKFDAIIIFSIFAIFSFLIFNLFDFHFCVSIFFLF